MLFRYFGRLASESVAGGGVGFIWHWSQASLNDKGSAGFYIGWHKVMTEPT